VALTQPGRQPVTHRRRNKLSRSRHEADKVLGGPQSCVYTPRGRRSRNQTGCLQATKILSRAGKFWMIRRFTSPIVFPPARVLSINPVGSSLFGPTIIAPRRSASHQILRTKCKESTDKGLKLKEGRRKTRERVKSGTRPHPTDFSAPASGRLKSSGTRLFFGRGVPCWIRGIEQSLIAASRRSVAA